MKIVYKIRRNSDSLFSKGGMTPSFSKEGKTWNERGHVSNHIALFNKSELSKYYTDCEIIQFRVEEVEFDSTPVNMWTVTKETARAKELQETRRQELIIERKKQEIAELENKLNKMKAKT